MTRLLGRVHRPDDRPMSRAHEQGIQRHVPCGWPAARRRPRRMGPSANGIPRPAGRSSRLTMRHTGEVLTAEYSPDGRLDRLGQAPTGPSGSGMRGTSKTWQSSTAIPGSSMTWRSWRTADGSFRRACKTSRKHLRSAMAPSGSGTPTVKEQHRCCSDTQLRLSGGVQPRRTMDRVGELGQDRPAVGCGNGGDLSRSCLIPGHLRAGLQPGRLVVSRSGAPMDHSLHHLERRPRQRRNRFKGPGSVDGPGDRSESRTEPQSRPRTPTGAREHHRRRDRRDSQLL